MYFSTMTNMFLPATFERKVFPGRVSELHSITLSLPKLIVDLNDESSKFDDDIKVIIANEYDHCDDGYCDGGDATLNATLTTYASYLSKRNLRQVIPVNSSFL